MSSPSSSEQQRAGFVVLIGRSNVGKSTLLNALIGTKIAITSPKPQTTRLPVQGILTRGNTQLVFVDTPGVFQSRDILSGKIHGFIRESLKDIDVVVYVADPTRSVGAEEKAALALLRDLSVPKILVINKIDARQKPFLESYRALSEEFQETIELSAKTGSNVNQLVQSLEVLMPESQWLYPKGQFTNMSNEMWLAELIREKLFLRLRQEAPYHVDVRVEETDHRDNGMFYVRATIFVDSDRYKRMVIGKEGRGIKEIGQSARRELASVMNGPVYLDLMVETDAHWAERY